MQTKTKEEEGGDCGRAKPIDQSYNLSGNKQLILESMFCAMVLLIPNKGGNVCSTVWFLQASSFIT